MAPPQSACSAGKRSRSATPSTGVAGATTATRGALSQTICGPVLSIHLRAAGFAIVAQMKVESAHLDWLRVAPPMGRAARHAPVVFHCLIPQIQPLFPLNAVYFRVSAGAELQTE